MLRSTGTLRVLEAGDAPELLALCDRHPVENTFVSSWVGDAGAGPSRAGGELWGWFEAGRLVSALWSGGNAVPVELTAGALEAFVARARRTGRRSSSLFGPADATLAMWDALQDVWGPARDVRPDQPLMAIDVPPAIAPHPGVRRARADEAHLVLPASVAMYTEEVGYSPVGADGGFGQRARVAERIGRGRTFVLVEEGTRGPEVVFKADLGAVSPAAAQVHGVYVVPHRRGEGIAAPAMAAVAQAVLAEVAPVMSLYVNAFNTRAIAAYQRAGMRQIGTFATVLF